MLKTDLKQYNNNWYSPGAGTFKRVLWYIVNAVFFASYFPFNGIKIILLKIFGAEVGAGLIIKPAVNIKYPWNLKLGNHVWIGEKVWIDNIDQVVIGDNACISQGALLLCGNHNFRKITFDLITGPVSLEEGVWIGASSIVCPGVICQSHAVLTAGSVATSGLDPYSIYQGNPAKKVKERNME